jgi:SpoVK/Ycf46/Vps4 family AAA+-type ATPase
MFKGRFHHLLHIRSPDLGDRIKIMEYFAAKFKLPPASLDLLRANPIFSVDMMKGCNAGVSGAEVENICREEAMRLLRAAVEASK